MKLSIIRNLIIFSICVTAHVVHAGDTKDTWTDAQLGACPCTKQSDESPQPNTSSDAAGDPIHLATGNVYEQTAVFTAGGNFPISFSWYYNSLKRPDPGNDGITLPFNLVRGVWSHSYSTWIEWKLAGGVVTAYVHNSDGQVVAFVQSGASSGSYTYSTNGTRNHSFAVHGRLKNIGSSYVYETPSHQKYTFDRDEPTGISKGKLTSITDIHGVKQTLTYTYASSILTEIRIDHDNGSFVKLDYSTLPWTGYLPTENAAAYPSKLTNEANQEYIFTYQQAQANDGALIDHTLLWKIKYPDYLVANDSVLEFGYYTSMTNPPANWLFRTALISETDEEEIVYGHWEYNNIGQGARSYHGVGSEIDDDVSVIPLEYQPDYLQGHFNRLYSSYTDRYGCEIGYMFYSNYSTGVPEQYQAGGHLQSVAEGRWAATAGTGAGCPFKTIDYNGDGLATPSYKLGLAVLYDYGYPILDVGKKYRTIYSPQKVGAAYTGRISAKTKRKYGVATEAPHPTTTHARINSSLPYIYYRDEDDTASLYTEERRDFVWNSTFNLVNQEKLSRDATGAQTWQTIAKTYAPENGFVLTQAVTDTKNSYTHRDISGSDNTIDSRLPTGYSTSNKTRSLTYVYTYYDAAQLKIHTKTITEDGFPQSPAHTWTYVYDNRGNVTQLTLPTGAVTEYGSYNVLGLPETITDVNNAVVTTLVWSSRGWLISSTTAGATTSAKTSYMYYSNGLLQKVTYPDGAFFTYEYNTARNLTSVTNNNGEKIIINSTIDRVLHVRNEEITVVKDASNNVVSQKTNIYDALNRVIKVENAAGVVIREYVYDLGVTDQLNAIIDHDDDGSNDTVKHTTAFTYTFEENYNTVTKTYDTVNPEVYTYEDENNNLVQVKDANNNITHYTYNGFNQVVRVDSPDSGVTVYQYDNAGNLSESTKGYGAAGAIVTSYTYDSINRPLTISYTGGADGADKDTTYLYDHAASCDGDNGASVGRLCQVKIGTGTTANTIDFKYDAMGNMLRETRKPKGTAGKSVVNNYLYSPAGELIRATYPGNRIVNYPQSAGKLTGITTPASGGGVTSLASTITYQPFGGINGFNYADNPLRMNRNFDTNRRLASAVLSNGTGSNSLYREQQYWYDEFNNIEGISLVVVPNTSGSWQNIYGYDALHRLTQEQNVNGGFRYDYTYDKADNRLTRARYDGDFSVPNSPTWAALPRFTDNYVYSPQTLVNIPAAPVTGNKTSNRLTNVVRVKSGAITEVRDFVLDERGNRTADRRKKCDVTTGLIIGDKTLALQHGSSNRLDYVIVTAPTPLPTPQDPGAACIP